MSKPAIERSVPGLPTTVPPGTNPDYPEVRRCPFFDGLADQVLAAGLASGGLRRQVLDRDELVADAAVHRQPGAALPVVLILRGQVAAAVFADHDLCERRAAQLRRAEATDEEREEESLLRPPPLARVAQKNVALFMQGELFNGGAALQGDQGARNLPTAFYTVAPSVLLFVEQRWLADVAAKHPEIEQRLRRALASSRERLAWLAGVKQELLDFFVRQGISVSGEKVRVRQLGLCIDCKQCEDACEDRYGARRLTLGGYHLGLVDFVYTCRTCTDQRCIDPCAYDSIRFDPERREVVINESTCTGCTACAQACPYGAIDMVEVVDEQAPTFKEGFKLRLDKQGALAFGPGTPRIAKPRRIASKCDHCATYHDQACVSACPTGSLIEVDAYDLFRERSPVMVAAAQAGFAVEPGRAKAGQRELLPVLPFTDGLGVRSGGLAKIRRVRFAPLLMWALGLLVWLVALGEILLRKYVPAMSYRFWELRHGKELAELPDALVLDKVGFRAGDQLSVYVGVVGTGLMLIAAIYPIFRRIKAFRWLASNTMWFDFHLMAGTVGPLFVLLHSALRLDSWVSAAFWSMAIVVASGVLGRYLYTQVPELSGGMELEALDHQRAFARARHEHPAGMAELDRELAAHRQASLVVARTPSLARVLGWLVGEDVRRWGRSFARRRRLRRLGVPRAARRDLSRRTTRMLLIGRSAVVAPKAQLLLHSWKKVHVPFTVLLTVFATAHIYLSWSRAW